eukprot:gene33150-40108_t
MTTPRILPSPFSPILHVDSKIRSSSVTSYHSRLFSIDNKGDVAIPEDEKPLWPAYTTLALLTVAFSCNQWSRQILFYLCDFSPSGSAFKNINVELAFSQSDYATLASLGFTLVFASLSLVAGAVADKVSRRQIVSMSCASWSVFTMLQGFASHYSDLVPLRGLLGASQAFYNPAAYTLLADIFPKDKIATANGVFSSGIYLGGALASLSILVSASLGWRDAMFATGAVGIVVAALTYLFLIDPKENTLKHELAANGSGKENDLPQAIAFAAKDFVSSVSDVLTSPDARLLYIASALRFFAGFTVVVWKAPFVFSKFQGTESLFAGSNAAVVAVGGLLSSLAGGYLSDYLRNTANLPRTLVPAIGSFLAAPLWLGFIYAETPTEALLYLLAEYVVAECWFGPTLASLFQVVPANRRGTAQGLFSLLTAVGNIGPVLVAALTSSQLMPLDAALTACVSVPLVLSGALFALAAKNEAAATATKQKM